MNARRSFGVALVVAVASLASVRAEVSAVLDGFGTYVQTSVLPVQGTRELRTWMVQQKRLGYFPLNVGGDRGGDTFPVVAENLLDHRRPYVVWSRSNGSDLDLVWSRWNDRSWSTILPVQTPTAAGDDVEPNLAFDATGRPHMAWWRNEAGGKGRIYLTIFLETIWMQEVLVSDPRVDSRRPQIQVLPDRTIQVDFETPHGRMSRIVTMDWPISINDDITPLGRISVSPSVYIGCGKH